MDATLYSARRGLVRTQHSLLWTNNAGRTWHDIAPSGGRLAQLPNAGVVVLPDGHEWMVGSVAAGSTSVTLMRRFSPTGTWTRSHVALGSLTIPKVVGGAGATLSFADPANGWLMIEERLTHESWGELLHTSDGGATWTVQAGQRSLPVVGDFEFVTPTVGFINANSSIGQLGWWTSRDAGRTWTRLHLPVPNAKRSDMTAVVAAPAVAGNAIVVAAAFTRPGAGDADGIGIYRSTDGGATWDAHELASHSPPEHYDFAAASDGSSSVLLRTRSSPDLQTFTWVVSRSTDHGNTFTDVASVHDFYPESLAVADPATLWAVGGSNGCRQFKSDCWSTTGLIASSDGGTSWHQLKLPA